MDTTGQQELLHAINFLADNTNLIFGVAVVGLILILWLCSGGVKGRGGRKW